jgi:hypothetical protein
MEERFAVALSALFFQSNIYTLINNNNENSLVYQYQYQKLHALVFNFLAKPFCALRTFLSSRLTFEHLVVIALNH